jgi:hypothetical protein
LGDFSHKHLITLLATGLKQSSEIGLIEFSVKESLIKVNFTYWLGAQHPIQEPINLDPKLPHPRSQSYVRRIYNYNVSVVTGHTVFSKWKKYFCFQNALGYSWRCKFLQRWRRNTRSYVGLALG